MVLGDTEARDQGIDRRAHGDASAAQQAVVARRRKRDLAPDHGTKLERRENPQRSIKVSFAPKALQNFRHDKIANYDWLLRQPLERAGLRGGSAVEIRVHTAESTTIIP